MIDKQVTKIHEIAVEDEPLLALLILAHVEQEDVFRSRIGEGNAISAPDIAELKRIKIIDSLQCLLDEVEMGGDIDRGRHYLMLRVAEQARRYFDLSSSCSDDIDDDGNKDKDYKALEDVSKRLDDCLSRLDELELSLDDDEKIACDSWLRNFLLVKPLEYMGHWTALGKKIDHLRKIYRRRRLAAFVLAIAAVTIAGLAFAEGRFSVPDVFSYGLAIFVVILGYLLITLSHLTMRQQISKEIEAMTGYHIMLETKEAAEKIKRELAFDLAKLGQNVAGKSEHLLYHEAEMAQKEFEKTAKELGINISEIENQDLGS